MFRNFCCNSHFFCFHVFLELPSNLQQAIKQALVREMLRNVLVFKNLKNSVLHAICDSVKTLVYSPNDDILTEGSAVRGIYVISKGEAIEVRKSGNDTTETAIYQPYKQGESFGSNALLQQYHAFGNTKVGKIPVYTPSDMNFIVTR